MIRESLKEQSKRHIMEVIFLFMVSNMDTCICIRERREEREERKERKIRFLNEQKRCDSRQ